MRLWLAAAVKNMKSFRSVISAESAGGYAQRWQPEDLRQPEVENFQKLDSVAILALFQPAENVEICEYMGGKGLKAVPWEPVEFGRDPLPEPILDIWPEFDTKTDAAPEPVQPVQQNILVEAEIEAKAIIEQAREQESAILQHAQATADALVADAVEEIEAEKAAARQQGFDEATAEAQSYVQAAQAILADVETWRDNLISQSGPIVIEMVKAIAQKMFGDGVALSDQSLQRNLNRVLTNVKSLGDLNIYLNPKDAAAIDSSWREVRSSTTGTNIRILPSEAITRGGCFVEGSMGSVDARVETQLKALLNTLTEMSGDEEEVE